MLWGTTGKKMKEAIIGGVFAFLGSLVAFLANID